MPGFQAVTIDSCLDFRFASDPDAVASAGFERFLAILALSFEDLQAAASPASPLPSRLEHEMAEILAAQEEPSDEPEALVL